MTDRYLNYVMQEAEKQGKLFFLDTGEGNDFFDTQNDMYVEDLSGWLIESHLRDQFIEDRRNENVNTKYNDFYVFALWRRDSIGNIEINFKRYEIYE